MQDAFINLNFLTHIVAAKGDIDLPDPTLSNLAGGMNKAEEVLEGLAARSGIHYEYVGEEGFKPISYTNPGSRIHDCIAEEVDRISQIYAEAVLAIDAEKRRVETLLGFDLHSIRASLNKFEADIGEAAKLAESSDALKYLQPDIARIATNFISVRGVLDHYEDIYRNVLTPIQKEGKRVLKAAARRPERSAAALAASSTA